MKYEVTVTAIGDFVLQLMRTRDAIIIFDKDVPYHYMNMVVSHTKSQVREDIVPGDKLYIAGSEYTVTDVGSEAMETLRAHGHVTLVFSGRDKVEQPGQIMLSGGGAPRLMVGDTIRFE
ncbi:PTS glucitol/sorbitol transporter subunit IIA [uncultured Mitsuokella sp.]|uniref:PTS glucitol/sorbitol transporter subunit IIA n=1 Tax=uncultured Mitsuokella sp. TaxID=453120 RepID=UPI00261A95A1|nr:PTS glucitol/sorbitol transporter subunit IIA [uncultured Mitsuokella sp.]